MFAQPEECDWTAVFVVVSGESVPGATLRAAVGRSDAAVAAALRPPAGAEIREEPQRPAQTDGHPTQKGRPQVDAVPAQPRRRLGAVASFLSSFNSIKKPTTFYWD